MLRYLENVLKEMLINDAVILRESSCVTIDNGIPQTSVIRPTLLNIAIYDSVLPSDLYLMWTQKIQFILNEIAKWCD